MGWLFGVEGIARSPWRPGGSWAAHRARVPTGHIPLGCKTMWYGSALLVADRWYPSSKTCSARGGALPAATT